MKGRSYIGVVVPAGVGLAREILLGVRTYCNEHRKVRLLLLSQNGFSPDLEMSTLKCSCVVTFDSNPDRLRELTRLTACPYIVATSNQRSTEDYPQVITDDHAAGRVGATYLIEKGYENLAFLQVENFRFSRERLAGFREVAEAHSRKVQVCDLDTQNKLPQVINALRRLPRPVGVMAVSDLHARWFIGGFDDPARWVPGRFSVLGVDDDPLDQALSPLPLSSIALAGRRIGYEAAALGMRWAESGEKPDQPVRIPPKSVLTRHSTDMLAFSDELVVRALQLMENQLDTLHDVPDLMRLLHIPRRTLEHRFTKTTGQSLGSFLTRARIKKARSLLSQTDLSIKEIAFLVGLSEPRMLSLVFKRETGETPTSFRARAR